MTVEEWKKKNPPILKKLQTNADRIRLMSDEELAEWMAQYERCVEHKRKCDSKCHLCWLDWLKSPVEEVQDGT